MIHPLFILDFYLEFNCIKWSEKIPNCYSNKYCEITYANVQGIDEIKLELSDKSVMKKQDPKLKPFFIDDLSVNPRDTFEIEGKYQQNIEHIKFYKSKLLVFDKIKDIIQEQKEEQKRQADERK